jgi:hypothetical protein
MIKPFKCTSSDDSDQVPSTDSFIDYAVAFQNEPTWERLSPDDKVEYLRFLADQYYDELYYRDRLRNNDYYEREPDQL